MAKRLTNRVMRFHIDDVANTVTRNKVYYGVGDDTDPDIEYMNTSSPCAKVVLSAEDLAMTVQTYLDACKASIETDEGIS